MILVSVVLRDNLIGVRPRLLVKSIFAMRCELAATIIALLVWTTGSKQYLDQNDNVISADPEDLLGR